MSQKLIQIQKEEQTQQLVAMQVALSRMLELSVPDLEERVRNEMDDNEALEESADPAEAGDATSNEAEGDGGDSLDDQTADYLTADDVPDYLLRQNSAREEREVQISDIGTSIDDLYRQVGEQNLSAHEEEVMRYLIGSLDTDGYLRKDTALLADEMDIYHGISATPGETERLRQLLLTFEPRGIGAKDLQECLLAQIDNPELTSPAKPLARQIVAQRFKDFALHHWDVLRQRLKASDDEFQQALNFIRRLNPKPGSSLGESTAADTPTVIPDFFVSVDDNGGISVALNRGDVPPLRVSQSFRDTVMAYAGRTGKLTPSQRDAYVYARKKVEDARFFIETVNRRFSTLQRVMEAIADFQRDFFLNEDDESRLRPMKLKDIAPRADCDISTVSRVSTSKSVRTAYGVYPLRFFFSSHFTASSGEELSSRLARNKLGEIIMAEDKHSPLTDSELSEQMAANGFPISRRTVVKYREQLGIPKALLRKI